MSTKCQLVFIQVILDMNGMYILWYLHDVDAILLPENLSTEETDEKRRDLQSTKMPASIFIKDDRGRYIAFGTIFPFAKI